MCNIEEIWKDVVGYGGLYKVSNLGHLIATGITTNRKAIFLKTSRTKGYHQVTLSKNSQRKTLYVHRLVAIHFIPNPENKEEVNHEFGNKDDNRACVLKWVTPSENVIHSHKTGLAVVARGERNGNSKLTLDVVMKIRLLSNSLPLNEICESFNVSKSNAWAIINRKIWTHC